MIGFRSSDLDGDAACETSSVMGQIIDVGRGRRSRDAVGGDRFLNASEITIRPAV